MSAQPLEPLESEDFAAVLDARSPSPNWGPRRDGARPSLVILHYTGMPSADAARARLCDPAAAVSAHYLIEETGRVWGLVGESRRAWHAGRAAWAGETDVNSISIGVELAHPGHADPIAGGPMPPFPETQMSALERLLTAVLARWAISPAGVLAHSDVAPGRKIDPGERFDWPRLAAKGLARPAPPPRDPADDAPTSDIRSRFAAALDRIGYGLWPDAARLDAFRRRWRPEAVSAPAELSQADLALAEALAAAPPSAR